MKNSRLIGLVSVVALWTVAPLRAAEPEAKFITPGRYMVTVVPEFSRDVASKIEKQFAGLPELKDVDAETRDSSIHFTVKEKSQADVSRLQTALQTAYADAVMTSPVLEKTFATNKGL